MTAGYDSYEAFDENGETLRCCEAIVYRALPCCSEALGAKHIGNKKDSGETNKNHMSHYVKYCQIINVQKFAMSAEEIRRNPFVRLEA